MPLALDESTWDLETPIRKTTPTETIRQTVGIRLKTCRGEWQFDTEQGLPYRGVILVKNPDKPLIEALVRGELALVPGIVSVRSASVTVDGASRTMAIEVTADTDEGLLTVTA